MNLPDSISVHQRGRQIGQVELAERKVWWNFDEIEKGENGNHIKRWIGDHRCALMMRWGIPASTNSSPSITNP